MLTSGAFNQSTHDHPSHLTRLARLAWLRPWEVVPVAPVVQAGRQGDYKARASVGWGLNSNLAAMQLDDLTTDVESQSHAAQVRPGMSLVKTLEDPRGLLGRNPDPTIAHRKPHRLA